MLSVWLTLRADLTRRWRPVLTLALLLGLAGGVVLTAATGARRTATAYPRLLTWARAAQLTIVPGAQGLTSSGTGRTGFYQALTRLPDVGTVSAVALFGMGIPVRGAMPDLNVNAMGSVNGALAVTADRVRLLAGRLPDPADPQAALIDPQLAAREHLRPGSVLHLFGVPHYTTSPDLRHLIPLTFRVSGIARFTDQIVPSNSATAAPRVILTPAFTREAAVRPFTGGDYAGVRLRPGASRAAFLRAATALAFRYRGTKAHPGTAGRLQVISNDGQLAVTERAIEPQVIALLAFAVLAGVIGLAVTGQLLARQLLLDAVEFPVLRALGMTRSRLAALILARAAVATAGGAVVAVAIAVAASPLMPIGPARLAEPSPGVEANVALLGTGATVFLLLPLVLVSPLAWRVAGRAGSQVGGVPAARRGRSLSLARGLSLAGSVAGGIGVRLAFEPGQGRSAVPVRSALAATALAVAAVAAALVFGASLIGLVATPQRYGQSWAQEVDFTVPAAPRQLVAGVMASQPGVTGYALGVYGTVSIAGHIVPAIGVDPVRGGGFVSMLAGRPPATLDEIALGGRTLRELRLRVGDRVPVSIQRHRYRLRIVGEPVFASFSEGGAAATGLGQGAQLPVRLLSAAYAPPFAPAGCRHGIVTCYSFILMRQAPGTTLAAANARLQTTLAKVGCVNCASFVADQRPEDIRDYAGVRDTPLVLSGVLALLAAGALSHVLLTSVRRRRRDLAVLKALGLTRRQVVSVVAWQATALAAAALAVGLPAGLVAGRWAWVIFARSAGVSEAAVMPLPLVLLAVPALVLIANVIALGPARTAARLRPALVLRAE